MLELTEIGGAVVRNGVVPEVAPDALHRVELQGIGRQVLECDGTALRLDALADELGAMRQQSVPGEQRLAAADGLQRLEERKTALPLTLVARTLDRTHRVGYGSLLAEVGELR
jgi:hypothetical protein